MNKNKILKELKSKSIIYSDNIEPNTPNNMVDEVLWSNINNSYNKGVEDTLKIIFGEIDSSVKTDKDLMEVNLFKLLEYKLNDKKILGVGVLYDEKMCIGVTIRTDKNENS